MFYNIKCILQLFRVFFYILLKVFFMNGIIEKINSELNLKGEIILKIKVVPNSKKNLIEKYTEEIVKIKINKPAVDGKANKAIIDYLSEILDVQKNNISILRGEKNSLKDLRIVKKKSII